MIPVGSSGCSVLHDVNPKFTKRREITYAVRCQRDAGKTCELNLEH